MTMQSTAQCARASLEEFCVEVDEGVEKTLSDIAGNLTSANRGEILFNALMSHLARILGGGLRTVW